MPVMYELFLQETVTTGSVYPNATSAGVVSLETHARTVTTGSWMGVGNSQGAQTLDATLTSTVETGLWKGVSYTQGVTEYFSESIDRGSISDEDPVANQSIGAGDWDPFPTPEIVEAPELPQRDTTRYRKAYSSQRNQPQRVRIIRR